MNNKTSSDNFFVKLTLTPEQARAVVDALDLYSRLHCGQFDELGRVIHPLFKSSTDLHSQIINYLSVKVRSSQFSTVGIAECPTKSAKIAYDVLQVVRSAEAHGRMPGGKAVHGHMVLFDDPLFVSESRPNPTASVINILDVITDL